ncbi:AcrR family transcriptional regulator [Sphingomonas vulcanisoli]|uniref:AcrR family transcriptional regulator n=1 Tax=Sphingomonas vulcanisoli TaxID=1658060 RepID=A0ABX0TXW8_9SPHN|nr:AcrR family transcriptional regulator [Sphingomonas vulcanisoli]
MIDAAVDIFGRQGFEGTSTRDIAAAAAVNTPAIQYYFGNKMGLYSACLDQLTGKVWRRIGPAVQACQSGLQAGATLEEIIFLLNDVQSCLIDAFFSDDEGAAIRRLLAWEDVEHDEMASVDFMKARIGLPIFQTFYMAVERVAATPMKPIEMEMHALSLMGISMIFHFNQSRVMDMLSWSTLDDGLLLSLKAVAQKQLAYAIVGLSRPDEEIDSHKH